MNIFKTQSIVSKLKKKDNKILVQNIFGTMFLKGLAMIISVFITPAYIAYFNDNVVLGAWFTLISLLNWIITFDFGIGNGLRNNLVGAFSKNDDNQAKKYISSAYSIIGLVALVVLLLGSIIVININWNQILNVSNEILSAKVLSKTVLIVFCGTIIQFWLKLITSILYSMQKTALSNSLSLISAFILLVFVLIYRGDNLESSLLYLAMVQILAINIPLLVSTILIFSFSLKNVRPSLFFYDKEASRVVLGKGGGFFLIQLSLLVINSTNEFLITKFYNASDVVEYQIYYKFFFLILSIFSLFTQPIWSAVTKAYEEQRYIWIKRIHTKFNFIAVVGALFGVILVIFLPWIVDIWLGNNAIVIKFSYSIVFELLIFISLLINSATCIANGIGRLKTQMFFTVAAAVAKIPLVFLFSKLSDNWITVIVVNCIILIPLLFAQIINLKKMYKYEFNI